MPALPPTTFIRQSGVIPFRGSGRWLEVLLVTTKGAHSNRWIVPKGNLHDGLDPAASAAREALEEAGVRGVIDDQPIGHFTHRKGRRERVVDLFTLQVTHVLPTWDEMFVRRRLWLPVDEAVDRVTGGDLKGCLRQLSARYALPAMTVAGL